MKKTRKSPRAVKESRREFIKKSALAATAVMAGCSPKVAEVAEKPSAPPPGSVLGANDRIVVGFVGVGGQGYYAHLQSVINRNDDGEKRHDYQYNAIGAAACDLFSKRRDRAYQALDAARAAEGRSTSTRIIANCSTATTSTPSSSEPSITGMPKLPSTRSNPASTCTARSR